MRWPFSSELRAATAGFTMHRSGELHGDDDGQYSDTELRDIFESIGLDTLRFDGQSQIAELLLTTLNNKFDAIRKFGGLEPLMTSMGTLYDKGYRFTTQDREALDRIMG
jgi:hypothetical protein